MSGVLLDIELATTTGSAFSGRQPETTPEERRSFGESIRRITRESDSAVRTFTGWGHAPATPIAEVVARPAWIRANLIGVSSLIERLDLPTPQGIRLTRGFIRRVFAVQIGGVLGYVSQKVLGQYDLFGGGRLLFVGPNMIRIERRTNIDPEDFRRWVAIHEVTHALQFTAVPWLQPHLEDLVSRAIPRDATDTAKVIERLRTALQEKRPLPELLLTPQQRRLLEEAQALMSVIEGHATFVMNEVGETVMDDLAGLRSQVEDAKGKMMAPERLVQKVTGLDRKRAQYGAGEDFFRAIVAADGLDAMRQVFGSAETLPSPEELKDPARWTARNRR